MGTCAAVIQVIARLRADKSASMLRTRLCLHCTYAQQVYLYAPKYQAIDWCIPLCSGCPSWLTLVPVQVLQQPPQVRR